MTIDRDLLRWCAPENLQRLARTLRVTLPAQDIGSWNWQRKAAKIIVAALERDRRAA